MQPERLGRTACPVAVGLVLLLLGCVGQRDVSRAWLVYVSDVPVARVTLASASVGNEVDVAVQGGTADVTLRHRGPARLEPLQKPPGLKVALHQVDVRALAEGRYADVERELNAAPSRSRDDLALSMLKATADAELARAAEREDGRRVLVSLYQELSSGSFWGDEGEQARRVLALWADRIGPERFVQAIESERTKIFPVRKSGPTVLDAVAPRVWPARNGLDISYTSKLSRYPEWRALGGMRLSVADDEVVGVKLYDEGGVVRLVPALFLLEVSNTDDRQAVHKCVEMAALGATLGVGGVAGPAGAGGRAARALLWCDRTAVLLGAGLTVMDDHRGTILERFGASGARFLRYADGLASLVALYGLGRVAVAVPRAIAGLRRAYLEMKGAKAALNAEEQTLLEQIGRGVDELEAQARQAGKGGEVIPIERARKASPVPAAPEEPLRATGTEGRLVPVASAGEDAPSKALNPAPPSLQPGEAPSQGGSRRLSVPAASSEAEIAAALAQRGIPAAQAQKTAQAAAEAGVLELVEVLVKSRGYRNPQRLRAFLKGWKPAEEGKIQALEDAVTRLRKGHEVALEGGGADVVDYTTREAIQHKRIFGESDKGIAESLQRAAFQLRGGGGEMPPQGFERVIDLRFDARSSSPLRAASRNMVRKVFPDRDALDGADRVRITTSQGAYDFYPPFPIH